MKMIAQLRVLVIALAVCATACSPPTDLFDWQKEATLWRDNTATEFARYTYPRGFLRARSAAYGCESRVSGQVVRKRIDLGGRAVPRVVGHTAYVFNRDGIAPGWYRLTVNHNLNWWQKNIFTFEALAQYTPLDTALSQFHRPSRTEAVSSCWRIQPCTKSPTRRNLKAYLTCLQKAFCTSPNRE